MPNKKGLIFIIVLMAVWAVLTWFVFRLPQSPVPVVQNQTSTPPGGAQAVSGNNAAAIPGGGTVSKPPTVPATTASKPASSGNYIISPAAGAQWVFEQANLIQWAKGAGVTGNIYLVNAADGTVAGWLIQQTNAHDTSFNWNTRDLYISRTSPIKKDVKPGKYIIKISFNSPQQPPLASAPFSIILPEQAQVSVGTLTIQNGVFSPNSISVKRGSKLIFANKDQATYHITISSFGVPFTLEPGGSYTFDTSPLSEGGTYAFYSASSSALRASVVIQ